MFYNLSEFMSQVKEDIGIKDVPLPVDDTELTRRFITSALREFSVRYPYKDFIWLTGADALDYRTRSIDGSVTYIIPEKYYKDSAIIEVLGLVPGSIGAAGANLYMPNVSLGSANMVLESVADIKMAAALGAQMTHAPTFEFTSPNRLQIYNGWTTTSFRVEVAFVHDSSLATVPPGAFTNLRELAILDIEEFLYNKMKRQTELDVGIGTIQLRIENWEDAGSRKRELLEKWDDSAWFDLARINYF